MAVRLRIVLDQVVQPTQPDLAEASFQLARELIDAAPAGCEVEALAPAGDPLGVPGLAAESRMTPGPRELARAWQLGFSIGAGGGMIHSPTLMAPLHRHDRSNTGDQIVVTLWDLRAWEHPEEMERGPGGWQRAMLRRAQRHADAIVVPSHAIADRLRHLGAFGERIRVIPGAVAEGYAQPSDADVRRRDLALPGEYIVVTGSTRASDGLASGLRAVAAAEHDVVVMDVPEGREPAVADLAEAAGVPQRRLHVRGVLERGDRAAVISAASAFVAPSRRLAWPWRAMEAMTLGVPVVACDSAVHREVILDGGLVVAEGEMAEALRRALDDAARQRVLATDRARAFSWRGHAEKVWQLHADL